MYQCTHISWAGHVSKGEVVVEHFTRWNESKTGGPNEVVVDVNRPQHEERDMFQFQGWSIVTSSSSFWVSSSIRRMSSMVKPTHLSIQQNNWRWKLVKIRFSCCGNESHHLFRTTTTTSGLWCFQSTFQIKFRRIIIYILIYFGLEVLDSTVQGIQTGDVLTSAPTLHAFSYNFNLPLTLPVLADVKRRSRALLTETACTFTLWIKFSTLVCRPHHLNLTVTSL